MRTTRDVIIDKKLLPRHLTASAWLEDSSRLRMVRKSRKRWFLCRLEITHKLLIGWWRRKRKQMWQSDSSANETWTITKRSCYAVLSGSWCLQWKTRMLSEGFFVLSKLCSVRGEQHWSWRIGSSDEIVRSLCIKSTMEPKVEILVLWASVVGRILRCYSFVRREGNSGWGEWGKFFVASSVGFGFCGCEFIVWRFRRFYNQCWWPWEEFKMLASQSNDRCSFISYYGAQWSKHWLYWKR